MDYCPYLLKQHNVERRGIIGHDFRGLLIVNLLRNFFQYVSSKFQNLQKKDTEIRRWRAPKQQLEQTSCGNKFRGTAEINPVLFYFAQSLVQKTRATLSTNQMQN